MLIINTTRDGYSPRQIKSTMTVGDLIELLQDYDESEKIYFGFDNCYTYGGLSQNAIEYRDESEEG